MPTSHDWIWQHPNWPRFTWQDNRLAASLRACAHAQGQLLGMIGATPAEVSAQTELDALLQNIITSSAIEGEALNADSVRSSLARRLGLVADPRVNRRSEGLAELGTPSLVGEAAYRIYRVKPFANKLAPTEMSNISVR